ncbi:transcriptional regulator [Streptomyces sp. NPDC017979]|uniref:transcriptional regulator n=1 Tax=Streptomyces sp. NPDC017979 TaxID=3365024 RepID=UPI0037B2CF45
MEANTLLDALLEEAGVSRVGLAARVNQALRARGTKASYDHSSVIRWLKGQRPRGHVPDAICEILGARVGRTLSLDDVGMGNTDAPAATPLGGFIERSTAMWRGDAQDRRDVQEAPVIAGLPAVGPVWEWENPPEDADVSRSGTIHVGAEDVGVLRTARSHYEQMYRKAGGVATRGRVLAFLNTETAPLLHGSYSDATGRELHRAAGGLVAVAGICAYDSDAQGLAQRYFHQALRLAKASGDRAFGGYVIALLVNQALFLSDYRQAVAFAEAGLRAAGAAVSHALACDLYAMQAKAYAHLGDAGAAHQAMSLAEARAGLIRREDEPAETAYVQQGLMETCVGEALTSLGDLGVAEEYAIEAARAPAHPRGRAHRLASLATVQARRGHADAAAATALDMLDVSAGMESRRLTDRLTQLRRVLAEGGRAGADAVAAIDETLRVRW